MSIPSAQRRSRYTWPKEAHRVVQKAQKAVDPQKNVLLLHEQLQQITGFSGRVCWSFLEKHGLSRPGAGSYKRWDPKTLDYVMDNGYDNAAERYGCDKERLYQLVHREGRKVGHGATYSVRALSKLMTVREALIVRWIDEGRLEASQVLFAGKPCWRISADQLRTFLSTHAPALILAARSLPEKRISFLEEFLYEGKHMDLDLLHTRESKKENDAFANGEYRIAPPRSVSDAGRRSS